MAPRKKRPKAAKTSVCQTRSVVRNQSTKSKEMMSEKEQEDPKIITTPSKHKNFGKYRCLIESNSDIPTEDGTDEYTEVVEAELDESKVSYEEVVGAIFEQTEDNITAVVSEQFATLNVNYEGNFDAIFSSLEKISENNYDDIQFMGECVSDEAIPVVNEQEIECESDSLHYENVIEDVIKQYAVEDDEDDAEKEKVPLKKPKSRTQRKCRNKKNLKGSKKPVNKIDSTKAENSIRRSNRIKSISVMKQKAQNQTKFKSSRSSKNNYNDSDVSESSNSGQTDSEKASTDSSNFVIPSSDYESDYKPVKVKSRWRRSSELEMGNTLTDDVTENTQSQSGNQNENITNSLKQYLHLKENQYLTGRTICKEAKKMVCDCFLTAEEMERGELGCGEDCLNKLLLIECGTLCPVNDRCTNKRFQKSHFSPCEVFQTDKKGLGIRATANISPGEFILEYIGEVIGPDEFEDRATEYSKDKNPHYYFMSLRSDAVIDATQKGNISRFINHSCEPNAETQKWTVNGELRIGFFSKRTILAGEEITFDYQFQRYGKEAQKCFCESSICRGWLGEEPNDDEEEEEEEDEEEELEEVECEKPEQKVIEVKEQPVQVIEDLDKPAVKIEVPLENKELETIPDATPVKAPTEPEIKRPIKIEKRKLIIRKVLKDMFDDVDVGEEIDMLVATGLKNQVHTLKLSRLMVRANETQQRSSLLRVLRHGEFSCRRLFLDYHGLRLIHGWMNDSQQHCKTDIKQESLRLELLQTLATLPIPNKTMLQDSKVLSTVEQWSKKLDDLSCSVDSESNSPQIETDPVTTVEVVQNNFATEEDDCNGIRKSVGMDIENIRLRYRPFMFKSCKKAVQDIIDMFDDDTDGFPVDLNDSTAQIQAKIASEQMDYEVEIIALAIKLLEEWSVLKEVFRIPKKERIEQMKEHEREANRGYRGGLEHDSERKGLNRYRMLQRHRKNKAELRTRKSTRGDRISYVKINKHERRKLFAMQVEQEEVDRRFKTRDMWRQHELQCMPMGNDPRFGAPFDSNRSYHCMWNQQTGQWQNYALLNPNMRFPAPMHYSYNTLPPPIISNMPPLIPNIPPPVSNMPPLVPNIPPPVSTMPPLVTNIPPPMPPINPSVPPPIPNIPTHLPPPNMEHHHQMHMPSVSSLPLCISSIPPPSTRPSISTPSITNRPVTSNNQPQSLVVVVPEKVEKVEIVEQVKFAGPIPPPVKLPPKWKCAKDKYGRPYYYHVKMRVSQWEPPEFPEPEPEPEIEEESSDSTSSSDTSSLSSDSSSEESEDDDLDDSKLLQEIRKKFNSTEDSVPQSTPVIDDEDLKPYSPEDSDSPKSQEYDDIINEFNKLPSLDERLKEEFKLIKKEPSSKRKRLGLVTQVHIISPRSEEDKVAAKENLRKYKENKERLKRQKEVVNDQNKKRVKVTVKNPKLTKKHKSAKMRLKEAMDLNSESAKRIKETFRSTMAGIMVGILNPYRKSECKEGKITNTEDFKHLARKLTHFVMLKELKHCQSIEDLICTDSVKSKAREFVRKYMSKFGDTYVRPKDDLDY